MRILIITDWFYPAFKAGGPVQSVVNMVELLKKQHEIFVYTGDRDLHDLVPFSGVQTDQWVPQNGYQILYHSPGTMNYKAVRSMIKVIKPDRIYLNSMFSNMILPILAAYRSGKIILAPRGMLRSSALQVKPIRKYFYLSFLKMLGVEKYIRFHATSDQEMQDIKKIFPLAENIKVAANLPVKVQDSLLPLDKFAGELRLIFVGRIHPIKNVLFLLDVLEQYVARQANFKAEKIHGSVNAGITLVIAATVEDKVYWQKCLQKIERLKTQLHIDLHLDCPHEKVQSLFGSAHLLVLPTLGENFGHAIFEALAVGCPVMISDQTPWQDLSAKKAGIELPLDKQKFGEQLQRFVMMNQSEWEELRGGALRLAKEYEQSQHAAEEYAKLLEID